MEADDRARDRLKIRRGGGRQPKRHCRLCLLTDNNSKTLGLWYRPQRLFNSGLREGSAITTALRRNGPLGLWSRPQRGQGEGKGAEENKLPGSHSAFCRGLYRHLRVLCVRVRCYQGLWWAKPHTLPFSPTHPNGRKEQRPHKETKTGR